jgi:hypothetical protein
MLVVFELGMTVGLVGLGIRILKSPPALGGRGKWVVLFGAGIIAALGPYSSFD